MHYSPFIPSQITSNFDFSEHKAPKSKRKKCKAPDAALEAELVAKRAELAETEYHLETKLRAVTERLVDDVFDARETQQRLLSRQAIELEELEKQKQELAEEKKRLAAEKRRLANKNSYLQSRASRQEKELKTLRDKLLKAEKKEDPKTAKKRPSLRDILGNLLSDKPQDGQEQDGGNPVKGVRKTTRILDLD